jgi:DNA-binding NarL/FixJ family response regulator
MYRPSVKRRTPTSDAMGTLTVKKEQKLLWYSLTDRQRTVAYLYAKSCRVPDIADQLFIQPATVKNTLKDIYKKLNIRDGNKKMTLTLLVYSLENP